MVDRRLAVLLALAALLPAAAARGQVTHADDTEVIQVPSVKPSRGPKPDLAEAAKVIVRKTNAFRRDEGRTPVEVSDKLTETAQSFADYMARTDRYGHTADGKRPADRAAAHGYDYCIVLENIAYQYNSAGFKTDELARGLFEGWKHSPGHRRNMLDADVTDTGVAVARSERTGYYYGVQMFGRPKSKAIEFEVANEADAAVEYRIGEQKFVLEPRYTRTHTRCRPEELTLQLPGPEPGAKGETVTLRPAHEQRIVVVKQDDKLRVKKEERSRR